MLVNFLNLRNFFILKTKYRIQKVALSNRSKAISGYFSIIFNYIFLKTICLAVAKIFGKYFVRIPSNLSKIFNAVVFNGI